MKSGSSEQGSAFAPHPQRFRFQDSYFGDPELHAESFVSEAAIVIGHVVTNHQVIIGPLASVRADEGIDFWLGKGSNFQEFCCLHGHHGRFVQGEDGKDWSIYIGSHCTFGHHSLGHGPLLVGKKTFVGFFACVHASEIGRNCFIDCHAIVRNSKLGKNCHIGAHAFVENVVIEDHRYVAPGQIVVHQDQVRFLPLVPKEMTDADNAMNKKIVDENKRLCAQYHGRRLDLMKQEAQK